jgi:hypothetical protein
MFDSLTVLLAKMYYTGRNGNDEPTIAVKGM